MIRFEFIIIMHRAGIVVFCSIEDQVTKLIEVPHKTSCIPSNNDCNNNTYTCALVGVAICLYSKRADASNSC